MAEERRGRPALAERDTQRGLAQRDGRMIESGEQQLRRNSLKEGGGRQKRQPKPRQSLDRAGDVWRDDVVVNAVQAITLL